MRALLLQAGKEDPRLTLLEGGPSASRSNQILAAGLAVRSLPTFHLYQVRPPRPLFPTPLPSPSLAYASTLALCSLRPLRDFNVYAAHLCLVTRMPSPLRITQAAAVLVVALLLLLGSTPTNVGGLGSGTHW